MRIKTNARVRPASSASARLRRIALLLVGAMLACYVSATVYFSYGIVKSSSSSSLNANNNKNNDNDGGLDSSSSGKGANNRELGGIVEGRPSPPPPPPPIDPEEDVHIVFSTGCNYFQHWQAEVLLNSHQKVGQKGKITRVVSGCETEHIKRKHARYLTHPEGLGDTPVPLEELKRSSHPNFNLYVTPSFDDAREFPWINKPLGLAHWLEHAKPKESVIVIVDPDMFFLDKLTHSDARSIQGSRAPFGDDGLLCSEGCRGGRAFGMNVLGMTDVVKRGRPVAQTYGLGGSWVKKYNVTSVVGFDSRAATLTMNEAAQYYSVGPPMMVHVEDLKQIMPLWVKLMYPVWKTDPGDIQADMYAYSFAAAHLGLPHLMLDNFMVSSPATHGEAWPFLELPNHEFSCADPNRGLKYRPTFIHMAQRYDSQTKFMFHKGHVPPNIFTCDLPLILEPPDDLIESARRAPGAGRTQWHKNYMLCNAYREINDAVVEWKRKHCVGEKAPPNFDHEIELQKDTQRCPPEHDGRYCWVFATWTRKMVELNLPIRTKY